MAVSSAQMFGERVEHAECERHGPFEAKVIAIMGREIRMKCPECARLEAVERQSSRCATEQHARQIRMERRISAVGIPLRFRGKSFANFIVDTDAKQAALKVAKDFAENIEQHCERGTTLVFSGLPGTGKSHLALAIAAHVMDEATVFYTNALDSIRRVRDTWRRDSEQSETEVLRMFGEIDLLIIDEVGVQYGTEGEQVIMFDIINRRYRDMRPTILLTNLGKQGMKEYLGERSFDRLREDGIWVAFDWESFRGKKQS